MDKIIFDGIQDTFLFEIATLLEQLEGIVLKKKEDIGFSREDINELFRITHTIKGTSGIMMHAGIARVAHKLEDVFYFLRENYPQPVCQPEFAARIFAVSDFIMEELSKLARNEADCGDDGSTVRELITDLDEFLSEIKMNMYYVAPAIEEQSSFFRIEIHYQTGILMSNIRAYTAVHALQEAARDMLYYPPDILSNNESARIILQEGFQILLQTGCKEVEIRKLLDGVGVQYIDIEECTAKDFQEGFSRRTTEALMICLDDDEFEAVKQTISKNQPDHLEELVPGDYVIRSREPGKGRQLTASHQQPMENQGFMSVSVQKIDNLMALIGEMLDAETLIGDHEWEVLAQTGSLSDMTKQLYSGLRELQKEVLSIKMVPLTHVFRKLDRAVFDVSRKLGKEVSLEIIGGESEVERNLLEHIAAPMMHLLQNAVVHGIEDKEERLAAGKEPRARIILEAHRKETCLLISIRDDGRGLDPQEIYQKALKKGLIGNRKPEEFTDREIYDLITSPGFSTSDTVTEYAGRGVGMNVVLENLREIDGRLEIHSTVGRGCRMILEIPLRFTAKAAHRKDE